MTFQLKEGSGKIGSSTLNIMILQFIWWMCLKIGGHLDKQINYKNLLLKTPKVVSILQKMNYI